MCTVGVTAYLHFYYSVQHTAAACWGTSYTRHAVFLPGIVKAEASHLASFTASQRIHANPQHSPSEGGREGEQHSKKRRNNPELGSQGKNKARQKEKKTCTYQHTPPADSGYDCSQSSAGGLHWRPHYESHMSYTVATTENQTSVPRPTGQHGPSAADCQLPVLLPDCPAPSYIPNISDVLPAAIPGICEQSFCEHALHRSQQPAQLLGPRRCPLPQGLPCPLPPAPPV
jgi:hypothetical protein